MQRRSIEAKELVGSFDDAFQATMSVLQDKGYLIDNADYKIGFIKGQTGLAGSTVFSNKFKYLVSVTIEPFGENRIKARVVFMREKILGLNSEIIQDPKFLQEIYDLIQKEIFVRQNLNK
jgi:hypothetical protein